MKILKQRGGENIMEKEKNPVEVAESDLRKIMVYLYGMYAPTLEDIERLVAENLQKRLHGKTLL